jgi:hypothetical protein
MIEDFWDPFFKDKSSVSIMIENGLYIYLGNFFTNSSGHPAAKSILGMIKKLAAPIF